LLKELAVGLDQLFLISGKSRKSIDDIKDYI